MIEFQMNLSSINDVMDFVFTVSRFDFDVDLISGRYIVVAKSIMGIFSLDLSKTIDVQIHAEDASEFMSQIDSFIVK